ncbi:molybdenum cofactor biosynthesis protein MoaE [Roseicitreum antarcticum]|uniref:Molybdopterin synthase catalytic subunit n=1 Tax=Roseicitreum antarcticum TaxID=564137 RepID=A0A1H3AZA4_9RHOB|nr:molybdenum cofactor biosynthesis protein MoaE [Roseicitreum antarcticum]SDX35062.1 molybdopterin synthase subunit MoaE [Roseicitreum antarcticum]
MGVRVEPGPFDFGAECAAFAKQCRGAGAIVTFCGLVRDLPDATLIALEIEHYPAMTGPAIDAMRDSAMRRWSLSDALIVHRFGKMPVGAAIMMVATAAPHRADAFAAAEFLMDYLKSRAPFWKKEITTEGARWVTATQADEDALRRW